jgi:hypothetical protein
MRRDTRALGRLGEALAAHLRRVGFGSWRNVHLRHASSTWSRSTARRSCSSVRLRTSAHFGSAAESVDPRKQRRIAAAAASFPARGGRPGARGSARRRRNRASVDPPKLEHVRDAFSAR